MLPKSASFEYQKWRRRRPNLARRRQDVQLPVRHVLGDQHRRRRQQPTRLRPNKSSMYVDSRKEKKEKKKETPAVSVPVSLANFYLRVTLDSDGVFGQFANHRGVEERAECGGLRAPAGSTATAQQTPSREWISSASFLNSICKYEAGFPGAESRSQRNRGRGALRIRRHDRRELALG